MEEITKFIVDFGKEQPIEQITDQGKMNEYLTKYLCSMVYNRSGGASKFEVSPEMQETFIQIFMYLNRNHELLNRKNRVTIMPWDLSKGLFLIGKFGRGKTLVLDMIYKNRDKLKTPGNYITAYQLSRAFVQDHKKFEEFTSAEHCLFLDEVGDEPKETLNFGNAENTTYRAMKLFFDSVEKQKNKSKLFATSNLGKDELIERYDERIWSRIVGNCNIVLFGLNDSDFRKK